MVPGHGSEYALSSAVANGRRRLFPKVSALRKLKFSVLAGGTERNLTELVGGVKVRCTTANAVQMVFPGMGTKAQPRESRVLEYPKGVVQAYWNVSGVRLRVKSSKDGATFNRRRPH